MKGVVNVKIKYLKPVLNLDATGEKIKTIMKQKGITVRELQIIMEFPYVQTIYNWFAGKNMPTIDNLVVLAKILGVPMEELIVTSFVETVIDSCEASETRLQCQSVKCESQASENEEILSA